MKKFVVILVLCSTITAMFFPVQAIGPCPINYTIKIDDKGEYPLLEFEFINTSIYTVKEAVIKMDFWSADGSLLKSGAIVTLSNLDTPGYYTYDSRSYYIKSYPELSYVSDLECLKIMFTNSYEWVNNAYSEPAASMKCLNETQDDKIKTDKGVLRFYDISQNSRAQKWYFWDDGILGWSCFGDSVSASLETDLPYITIKLEINNDPNFYSIKTFDIAQDFVAVRSYATEEVIQANREFKFNLANFSAPYAFGLWDFNDSAVSRKWYKWDDATMSWQQFSAERGPVLVLDSPSACIKLEYNDNFEDYRIIEIYISN